MASTLPIDTNPMNASMKSAATYSFLFHILVVVGGMISLPYMKRDILPPAPISVEIVEIDEITQTNKRAFAPKEVEKEPEEIKPAEDKPPAPPKVDLKEPPKTVPLDKPKPKEKEIVKPKEVPPPPKPEELKKPEEKPKEEAVAEQEDQFASLLKNLQDGAPEQVAPEQVEEAPQNEPISPLAAFPTA